MDTTEIKKDIRRFADPGSDVLTDGSTLIWERDGRTREATLRQSDDGSLPDVCVGDAWMKYRDFLAGPEMADLYRLAQFVVKTAHDRPEYVRTLARAGDTDDQAENQEHGDADAVEVVESRSTRNLPYLATRVVLVQGEAGSGKTMVLRHMTLQRAKQFMDGSVKSLFFYVDVQGRSLSRLDDAMARELQDLRARFTYSAVTPLVRSGLLVPVIDGFDELLGSGGYDEAFSSLAAFVATLEQRGAVVASARSSFFDYNNFREYATRFGWDGRLGYRVDPVRVQPWRDTQADEYVETVAAEVGTQKCKTVLSEFQRLRRSLDDSNRRVLSKPFYVSRVAELLLMEGVDLFSDTSLLDRLVEALVSREHKKLLNKDGTPLMSQDQHRLFLAELAMEMWWQESRILDFETVQELAALLAEDYDLPPDAAKAIRSRVSSYAFLTTADTDRKTLRFEHEVFYSYFLASKIGQCLEQEPDDLRRFLNRSVLDDIVTEEVARNAATNGRGYAATIESVCAAVRQGFMDVVGRENGGRLVARLIADSGKLRPVGTLRDLVFRHERLGPANLDKPHFFRCEFHEVDFTRIRMQSPRFEGCTLRLPVVSIGQTKFHGAQASLGEQVQGIRVGTGDEEFPKGDYFAPGDVHGILSKLGMESTSESKPTRYTSAQQHRIRLLNRFLHKMDRRFYVSEADLGRFSTTRDLDWQNIHELLKEHRLLIEQSVQKAGHNDKLLRLSHPPDVIRAGEDTRDKSRPELSAFWHNLLNLDSARGNAPQQ